MSQTASYWAYSSVIRAENNPVQYRTPGNYCDGFQWHTRRSQHYVLVIWTRKALARQVIIMPDRGCRNPQKLFSRSADVQTGFSSVDTPSLLPDRTLCIHSEFGEYLYVDQSITIWCWYFANLILDRIPSRGKLNVELGNLTHRPEHAWAQDWFKFVQTLGLSASNEHQCSLGGHDHIVSLLIYMSKLNLKWLF